MFQSFPTNLIGILGRKGPKEASEWIRNKYGFEYTRFFIENEAFIYDEESNLVKMNDAMFPDEVAKIRLEPSGGSRVQKHGRGSRTPTAASPAGVRGNRGAGRGQQPPTPVSDGAWAKISTPRSDVKSHYMDLDDEDW